MMRSSWALGVLAVWILFWGGFGAYRSSAVVNSEKVSQAAIAAFRLLMLLPRSFIPLFSLYGGGFTRAAEGRREFSIRRPAGDSSGPVSWP